MNQDQLRQVYEMVDRIPFSRTKKNINRDFSDGVMMAQLIHHYRPKLVQLHSYPAASSVIKKIANWQTLNTKVLKKLGLGLSKKQIQDISNSVPMVIQNYLYSVLNRFQSPAEQINIRQQIKKSQPLSPSRPRQTPTLNLAPNPHSNNSQSPNLNHNVDPSPKSNQQVNKQLRSNIILGKQTDEVFQLIEQIQDAYTQLLKLQQISKLKDQVIKNLEKKVQKMIFS